MATREIKTRFKLEGEQTFKKAMTDAASKVKVLNSEEKLAEAQFKATGDAEKYAADKANILRQKISAQKDAVKAAEDAIKSLTENGVQENDKKMQAWRTRLNNARTSLVNMESQLSKVEESTNESSEAFEGAGDSAKGFQDQLEKIGKGVDFGNLMTSIDNITGKIEGVVKAAAKAAKAVWDLGVDAGKWADELTTAAKHAGVDVETYQSWQYAARFVDTSVEDIQNSWQDITKRMKDGDEDFLDVLSDIGVAGTDAAGNVRDSQEIFWDTIDALNGIEDEQKRAAAATKIFGNDWRKLNPLIEAGSSAFMQLAEEGKTVAVVSQENVEALSKSDDEMQKLEAQFSKLKFDTLAALAPIFEDVASAMSEAVSALNEFIQSEEGRQALEGLREAVSGLISAFLGEDGGKGKFADLVNTAKDAVKGLTDALDWISKNGETVKGIVTGLGLAWAGLKVSEGVLAFMQILEKIPLAKLATLFGSGAGATAAGATASAAGATAAGATATGTAMKTVGASLGAVGAGLGTVVSVAGLGYLLYLMDRAVNTQGTEARETREAQLGGLAEDAALTGSDEIINAWKAIQEARNKLIEATGNGGITPEKIKEATETDEFQQAMMLLGMQDVDWTEVWKTGGFPALIGGYGQSGLFGDLQDQLYDMSDEASMKVIEGLENGVEDGLPDVQGAGEDAGNALIDGTKEALDEHSPSVVFDQIGQNAAIGLANGIYARGNDVAAAARWLAGLVRDTVQSELQIHSPSRVFENFGAMTGLGFAQGIEQSAGRVSDAVGVMLSATSARPAVSFGGLAVPNAGGAAAGAAGMIGGPGTVHVTLMLDEDVLGDVMAPIVNDKIGAKISATRRY